MKCPNCLIGQLRFTKKYNKYMVNCSKCSYIVYVSSKGGQAGTTPLEQAQNNLASLLSTQYSVNETDGELKTHLAREMYNAAIVDYDIISQVTLLDEEVDSYITIPKTYNQLSASLTQETRAKYLLKNKQESLEKALADINRMAKLMGAKIGEDYVTVSSRKPGLSLNYLLELAMKVEGDGDAGAIKLNNIMLADLQQVKITSESARIAKKTLQEGLSSGLIEDSEYNLVGKKKASFDSGLVIE